MLNKKNNVQKNKKYENEIVSTGRRTYCSSQ
jgi:hypothetical protein